MPFTKDLLKDYIAPSCAVLTALIATGIAIEGTGLKKKLDQQHADFEKRSADTNDRKMEGDRNFRIYDAVVASLKSGDLREQAAAQQVVDTMSTDPMRGVLHAIFATSDATVPQLKKDSVKALDEEKAFNREEAESVPKAAPAQASWAKWNIDVFYCEDVPRTAADAILQSLRNNGADGRLRSRKLPSSLNAMPSYSVRGYEVRFDTGESDRAEDLKTLAQTAIPGTNFELHQSSQGTPGYLSVFLCPAPSP